LERLWAADEGDEGLDVVDLHRLVGKPRRLTRNTIHSTLERLIRKGLASRRRRGRAYEYAATASRETWISEVLDAVAAGFSLAEPADMLVGFVDFADRASETTLEALEDLVRTRLRERGEREYCGERREKGEA
jgi:predicted transcriptional regulator